MSYFVVLAGTYRPILNKNAETKHVCIASDLRGESIQFSINKYNVSYSVFVGAFHEVEKTPLYFYIIIKVFFKIMN